MRRHDQEKQSAPCGGNHRNIEQERFRDTAPRTTGGNQLSSGQIVRNGGWQQFFRRHCECHKILLSMGETYPKPI